MMTEYEMSILIATVILIVFSIVLGFWFSSLGFGTTGLQYRLTVYCERRQTALGRSARPPTLVRHAANRYLQLGWFFAPIVANGGMLLALYIRESYAWVPVIAMPLVLMELLLGQWILQKCRPVYQADFETYMRLTRLGNRRMDGHILDLDLWAERGESKAARLLDGGKIISLVASSPDGSIRNLRLFLPLSNGHLPLDDSLVRAFYVPVEKVQGKPINGVLIGYQQIDPASDSPPQAPQTIGKNADERTGHRIVN